MNIVLLLIMALIVGLTGIASDIYLPAILDMAGALNTTVVTLQSSMAIFTFGVAFSQLIWGPLSEAFGRKRILLLGLIIVLVGHGMCYVATEARLLLLGRITAGIGAGSCACLWRAIFRDSFDVSQMARFGAYLGLFMTFVVPAAPMLGGYLHAIWDWQAIFLYLLLYAGVLWMFIYYYFKETNIYASRSRLKISFWMSAYGELLKSPIFMGYSLCVFFTYGSFFSWFIIGPVLMMDKLGLMSIQCGWVNFILGASSMSLASFLNARWVRKYGSHALLQWGWGVVFMAASLMLVSFLIFDLTFLGLIIPVFIFLFGSSFIWPNAFAQAFAPFGHIAGYAGALYSFMQLGGGALLGWISAFLPQGNPIFLSLLWGASVLVCFFIFYGWLKPLSRQQAPSH